MTRLHKYEMWAAGCWHISTKNRSLIHKCAKLLPADSGSGDRQLSVCLMAATGGNTGVQARSVWVRERAGPSADGGG